MMSDTDGSPAVYPTLTDGVTRNRQVSSGSGRSDANGISLVTIAPDSSTPALAHPLTRTAASSSNGHTPTGTTLGTFINIFKNILGSGMLAVPYTFSLCGWGQVLVLLVVVQACALLNLFFIMKASEYVRAKNGGDMPHSFQELAEAAFQSRRAGTVIEAIVACYTWATLIAYGVLIAQLFGSPLEGTPFIGNKFVILAVAAVVLIPLCSMQHIEMLKTTSVMGNLILGYTVALVVYNAFDPAESSGVPATPATPENLETFDAYVGGTGVLQALPTLLFSFNFHYNMPLYYRELEGQSIGKMSRIILGDYSLITLFYLLIGFAGYYSYGDEVQSNIINNLPTGRASTTVCQLLLGVMILCTFPVVQYACRGALGRLFLSGKAAPSSRYAGVAATEEEGATLSPSVSSGSGGGKVSLPLQKRVALSVITVGVALTASAVVPNIGVVLAFNGAIFGVGQQYFAPTLCFYKLSRNTDAPPALRNLSLCVFFLGIVVMVLGLFGTIMNIVKGNSR